MVRELLTKSKEETVVTNVFTGRPARCVNNHFIKNVTGSAIRKDIPKSPLPHSLIMPLRILNEKKGNLDYTSVYAGQNYFQTFKEMKRKFGLENIQSVYTEDIIRFFFPNN